MRGVSADRGAAVVELALGLPVLAIVLVGTIDFARISYTALALSNAARAGAQYGAQSLAKSSDTSGMQTAAQTAAAADIGTITASAARTCGCNGAAPTAAQCSASCSTALRVFVSVTASKTFTTNAGYIGIPYSIPLSRTVVLRAQ